MSKHLLYFGIHLGVLTTPLLSTASAEELPLSTRFSNLPEEQRKQYTEHSREASRLFGLKRIFETLEEIHHCEKLLQGDPNIINLKGACYVEFRDFAKAREVFQEALALTNNSVNVLFNLAELEFVQHQWKACHESLKVIEAKVPNSTAGMHRLVVFKSFLCKIKLAEASETSEEEKQQLEKEITEISESYDFRDDSPIHYYLNASLAFREDNSLDADRWIGRARRIFPAAVLSSWQDTLIEYGYIRSFYGGDAEPQQ